MDALKERYLEKKIKNAEMFLKKEQWSIITIKQVWTLVDIERNWSRLCNSCRAVRYIPAPAARRLSSYSQDGAKYLNKGKGDPWYQNIIFNASY